MQKNTPEYYGYTIGKNIVPYINQSIRETKECVISEGIHIFGRNDKNWNDGNVWQDSTILWGWHGINDDVKLYGAGIDKTILKLISNVHTKALYDIPSDTIFMLQTNFYQSCNNAIISGITWDGNYSENSGSSTINAIRIRGSNVTISGNKFINFGVGNAQKCECFQVSAGPINQNEKGPTVKNNIFSSVGLKHNSPKGFVPENTLIAVNGAEAIVSENTFIDCVFNKNTQQSPLHGIAVSFTTNSIIENNTFKNFSGTCIYMDSWKNENLTIQNNSAINVWEFIQLTCQPWQNPDQISFHKNYTIINNDVILSDGETVYEWDLSGGPSSFFGYVYSNNLDPIKYPAFENIIVKNNKITLGYYRDKKGILLESYPLVCYLGREVDASKIKMEDNIIKKNDAQSTPLKSDVKVSFFKRIINFFVGLFRRKKN
jgi:hypothetical protein